MKMTKNCPKSGSWAVLVAISGCASSRSSSQTVSQPQSSRFEPISRATAISKTGNVSLRRRFLGPVFGHGRGLNPEFGSEVGFIRRYKILCRFTLPWEGPRRTAIGRK